MPAYRVVNAFVDSETRQRRTPGEIINVSQDRGARMVSRGLVAPLARQSTPETASVAPTETAAERTDTPRHVGGGYYELPNGERVHGRETAMKRMQQQ